MGPEEIAEAVRAHLEDRDDGLLRQINQRLERIQQQMQIADAQWQSLMDGITKMTVDQQAANQTIISDVQKLANDLTAATGQPTDISSTIAAIAASDQAAQSLASQVDGIVNPPASVEVAVS